MGDRLREWIRQQKPWIERALGGRLEYQLPALGASVVTHALILVLFAAVGFLAAREESPSILEAAFLDTELPELRDEPNVLAETDRATTIEPVAGSFAPRLSPRLVENAESMPELDVTPVELPSMAALPAARMLGARVDLKGDSTSDVGVEGAVDRLAVEILRHLEKGPTLVIWAFDASGSLQAERQRLAEHIEQVYTHVFQRQADAADSGSLLAMVVGFGQGRKALTPEPTQEPSEIAGAIREVPLDESGVENTFQMVADAARTWGKIERDGRKYRPLLVVITDEVGDDEPALEAAIASARKVEMPVFVLGSPALFGRAEGYMDYTDPRTGRFYPGLPVRQGPESVALEQIRLPFWYDGPQFDMLDAGFGPYGLSRLAGATGGIYFVTRLNANRPSFDPMGMREYRPDWISADQYRAAIQRHPIRQAVLAAAEISQQNLPGQPSLQFPAAESPDFKEAMERNQTVVARVIYTVDEALVPVNAALKARDRETSRRWQAHYDLVRARLLAMKIRCYEYNWACAQMRTNPRKFEKPNSNAWRLRPDPEVRFNAKAAEAAKEATRLLERVVTDHPGTPWALLAQRELKDPFGFRWEETYVPPPPPRRDEPGNNAARKKAMSRPQQPEAVPRI